MAMTCFEELRGTQPDSGQNTIFYAVLNWRERRDHLDVACYQRLTPAQERSLRKSRAAGKSDPEIFSTMFPSLGPRAAGEADAEVVSLPLMLLTQEQLIALVQQRLGREVPGFSNMPLAGVRELWRALQKK